MKKIKIRKICDSFEEEKKKGGKKKNKKIKVKIGIPNVEDYIYNHYGPYFKLVSKSALELPFDKLFKNKKFKKLNTFVIKPKQAYYMNHELIYPYVNYFIKYFDKDDELLVSYLKIKFMIDRKKKYGYDTFRDDVYSLLLSDSMVDKIKTMVSHNYAIDLSAKKDYKHKSIQFLNEHGVIILEASMALKIMIPLVTHYIHVNGIGNTDKFLGMMFSDVFSYFERGNNMQNKIYEFVLSKLKKTQSRDKGHWNKVEVFGKDMDSETSEVAEKINTDILYKCHFKGNIAAFFTRVVTKNTMWMLKENFKRNLHQINTVKEDDGLSDLDKIEMNMSKMDESFIAMGELNVKHIIKKLKIKYGIEKFDKDELEFYMENVHLNKLQEDLFNQIFGKYFGSIRDMYAVDKKRFAKLVVIFKTMMAKHGFKILQHIIIGDMQINPNVRKLTKKETTDIINSGTYKFILKKYSYTLNLIIDNKLFRETLTQLLNSNVKMIDYNKEVNGKKLKIKDNFIRITGEYLKLIAEVI